MKLDIFVSIGISYLLITLYFKKKLTRKAYELFGKGEWHPEEVNS